LRRLKRAKNANYFTGEAQVSPVDALLGGVAFAFIDGLHGSSELIAQPSVELISQAAAASPVVPDFSGPGVVPFVSVITIGDSVFAGNSSTQWLYSLPYQLVPLLGPLYAHACNVAVPGATIGDHAPLPWIQQLWSADTVGGAQAPAGAHCIVPGRPNLVVTDGGSNDVALSGDSAAAVEASMAAAVSSWSAELSGASSGGACPHCIVVATPTGRTGFDLSGVAALYRASYASWGASGVTVVLADLNADPDIGNSADFSGPYFVDGVHLTQAGVAIAAGIVKAALDASGFTALAEAHAPARLSDAITSQVPLYYRWRGDSLRVTAAGHVLGFDDLSGNGLHVSRPPVGNRPAFSGSLAAYDGQAAAAFDGSTQDVPWFTQWSPAYAYAGAFGFAPAAAPLTFLFVGNCTDAADFCTAFSASPQPYLYCDASAYAMVCAGGQVASSVEPGTDPHVFCCVVDAGGIALYVDDHASPVGTLSAAQSFPITSMDMGAISDSGGENPALLWKGYMAEFMVAQADLSLAQRALAFSELGARYGISTS
jgi:hypothetical protein